MYSFKLVSNLVKMCTQIHLELQELQFLLPIHQFNINFEFSNKKHLLTLNSASAFDMTTGAFPSKYSRDPGTSSQFKVQVDNESFEYGMDIL